MPGETDSVKIARIDQRTINTERTVNSMEISMNQHLGEDTRRFEMVFKHFNERLDKFEEKLDRRILPLESDVEDLLADKNNREGAIGVGKWVVGIVSGAIAACVTAAIAFFTNTHGGGSPIK